MKKSLLFVTASFVALSFAAPAGAADLAARPYYTKAPPPMVSAIYNWSGLYVGLNGGYGSSHNCWDVVDIQGVAVGPASEGCHDATGGTFGGQIGYRWQASNWVFGVEGQGNWADFSGSNDSQVFNVEVNGVDTGIPVRNRSRIDAFGLITGQVGYAWNNVLLYVKGGAAVVDSKFDTFDPGTGTLLDSARSRTQWGGTVGVGLEYAFTQNWSVGVEYNHIFLGDRNAAFVTPAGVYDNTDRIKQDVDLALVRVNYRFGGPVVARY